MQAAVPAGVGAMAAIQRLEDDAVFAACDAAPGICEAAVFNAPKLVVISGETAAVEHASAALAEQGGIVRALAVSAPFHCQLLAPAAEQLAADLAQVEFSALRTPYVANVDATWVEQATTGEIRDRLVRQVVGAVLWRDSIALMIERGVERFWHLGPGRANLTHVKRQARKMPMGSLDTERDLEALLAELGDG